MSSNELMKFNWLSTDLKDPDLKNFLVLFAKHLQKNDVYLIPNGFILKQPEEFITEKSNTVIDIIGVPFRNVVGRRKFYYNRIYISAFYNKHKFKMGTRNRPLQLNYTGDDTSYLNAIKKRIASVTNTQEDLFKLEIAELIPYSNVRRIKIKFNIKPLEFKTEESGLSLYNDSDVYIYVKDRTVNPIGILTRVEEESYVDSGNFNYASLSIAKGTFIFNTLTNDNGALPEYLKLPFLRYEEDVSDVSNFDFKKSIENFSVHYSIPEEVDIKSLKVLYEDESEIEYHIDKEKRTVVVNVNTLEQKRVMFLYRSPDLMNKKLIYYVTPNIDINYIEKENSFSIYSVLGNYYTYPQILNISNMVKRKVEAKYIDVFSNISESYIYSSSYIILVNNLKYKKIKSKKEIKVLTNIESAGILTSSLSVIKRV